MKLEGCLRCNHKPDEKDKYCIRCGAPLINRCTHDGGPLGDPCNHVNHHQAAFCAKCGSRTTFYEAGLLSAPYLEENKKTEVDDDYDSFQYFSHKFFQGF